MITALAGGVGASKLLRGMVEVVRPEDLTVIVNTGDDLELFGLYISPDVDIVTYTLAGLVDEERGWGFKGDTFNCLEMLSRYGHDTWFKLGDKDLATHLHRTLLMKRGYTLSEATAEICRSLGVRSRVIPMSNDRVVSMVHTDTGTMTFEEYLVKHGMKPEVRGVYYEGADKAKPAPGVIEALDEAKLIVICPSNPVVSIGPILAVEGVRRALREAKGRVVAVSPIIAGRPVKGPADRLLKAIGVEVSAYGVAELYRDFLDVMIIDEVDAALKPRIEDLGIEVVAAPTLMKSLEDKVRLAKIVLSLG
ncbi:MAG: 2-phospho-L-lactate transferase [Thermoprotei archaeon]|nr:MAG: 2-phospho-L-lactate transferase [Thermoprotei archaeon]